MTEILEEFKQRLAEKFGYAKVVLFGSYSKSAHEKESDMDALVILDREVDIKAKETVYDIAYELSLKYEIVLDVSVYSIEDWNIYKKVLPFAINVEREGEVI